MVNSGKMKVLAIFFVIIFALSTTMVFARGGFGGGGFSGGGRSFSGGGSFRSSGGFSSGRSSGSFSRPSSSSSSFHSSGSSTRSSGGFFSRPSSTPKTVTTFTRPDGTRVNTAKMSATDKVLITKAQTNHTVFSSRSQAQTAFKQKYANQYTSTFKTEPKVRPDHIPYNQTIGTQSYPIVYGNGGYGYYDALHMWIMYDMFKDAAMRDKMMNQNNYIVQHKFTEPIEQHKISVWWILLILITAVFIGLLVRNYMFRSTYGN